MIGDTTISMNKAFCTRLMTNSGVMAIPANGSQNLHQRFPSSRSSHPPAQTKHELEWRA